MAETVADVLNAMLGGATPPAREAVCPSCMGSLRILFVQSGDDPARVAGEARCGHCHEEDAIEDHALSEEVRRHLLETEGIWRLRIKEPSAAALEAARAAAAESGLRGIQEPPEFEGTQIEMQFLATRLRARNLALAVSRAPA